jgi:hypothetical protein
MYGGMIKIICVRGIQSLKKVLGYEIRKFSNHIISYFRMFVSVK